MINLKKLLTESMTTYVKDVDYDRHDNLMDLSFKLQRRAYMVLEKLPEDQQEYFRRNRPPELLTIDGDSDMDSNTGVLNLYFVGYTSKTLKEILKSVSSELKRLDIKTGRVKMEDSRSIRGKVIRIPIISNENKYHGPPVVNFSNRNAYHIFHEILQYDADDEYNSSFSFKADDLKSRIEAILQHDPDWIRDNQIKSGDMSDSNPHNAIIKQIAGNATIIDMGLDSDDIKQRLMALLNLANWAIKNGKSDLYVT